MGLRLGGDLERMGEREIDLLPIRGDLERIGERLLIGDLERIGDRRGERLYGGDPRKGDLRNGGDLDRIGERDRLRGDLLLRYGGERGLR